MTKLLRQSLSVAQATHALETAALRAVLASGYAAEGPNSDAEAEYAHEQMCLAARNLVHAVDAAPADSQPLGWWTSVQPKPAPPETTWRPVQAPSGGTLQPWQMVCRAQQQGTPGHSHACGTEGDLGHTWHYCPCGHSWQQAPPACCLGTGYADYAAVPCLAPDCPVPTTTPTNGETP